MPKILQRRKNRRAIGCIPLLDVKSESLESRVRRGTSPLLPVLARPGRGAVCSMVCSTAATRQRLVAEGRSPMEPE